MESIIKINLFGSVRLTNGAVSIDEDQIHSNRLLTLLAYLIIHRNSKVMNKVLCKQFIGEECKNPEGTLKNLMYRLRCMLKVLGPEDYICTLSGEYRWNPELQVEVDYERFGELYTQIRAEQDPQKKKALCIEAAQCYRGNFSPEIAGERWIISWFVENQSRYIEIVNLLGKMYEEAEEWSSMEQLCQEALVSEPYEEDIHGMLIRSLQRQKKYDQATEHYENTKKAFYKNFGVWNPEALEDSISEETQELREQTLDLVGIQKEIQEAGTPTGVYFCSYQIFQKIYQLEVRRVGRMGISEYLLLLTVRRQGGSWGRPIVDRGIASGVETLEEIIRSELRIGDVAARSGQTQFAVLLSACSFEAGIMVAERIYKDFKKKMKKEKLELRYELGEIFALQRKKGVIGE